MTFFYIGELEINAHEHKRAIAHAWANQQRFDSGGNTCLRLASETTNKAKREQSHQGLM